jgi:hypothetical protein
MPDTDHEAPSAEYLFRIRFRVESADPGVTLSPNRFESVLSRRAATPGEDGWLFFRDNLWRGEAGDERHLRELAEDSLGLPVESVEFRELRTDPAYLDALREAIADDLSLFKSDSVDEVLKKYLGSSIHVRESQT